MTSDLNLFERPAEICYCVPNGASLCAPCRERRQPAIVAPQTKHLYPDIPAEDFIVLDEHHRLCEEEPCPNCGSELKILHYQEGCSCFVCAPCSYCTEQRLHCDNCDLLIDIESA